MKPAIVLLSGGMDSAVTLAEAVDRGYEPHALSFRYGQHHVIELDAARKLAQGIPHLTIDVTLFGASALTDGTVPKHADVSEIPAVPSQTYVPARNTVFLSYALALAETIPAGDIFIGVNALDYGGYPDCRPEYLRAFEKMAALGTMNPVTVHAPLIAMTKTQIITRGLELGVDFSLTHSCYDPQPDPCGSCAACLLRRQAFTSLGMDPCT